MKYSQGRAAKGFLILSLFFFLFFVPIERLAARETGVVCCHYLVWVGFLFAIR